MTTTLAGLPMAELPMAKIANGRVANGRIANSGGITRSRGLSDISYKSLGALLEPSRQGKQKWPISMNGSRTSLNPMHQPLHPLRHRRHLPSCPWTDRASRRMILPLSISMETAKYTSTSLYGICRAYSRSNMLPPSLPPSIHLWLSCQTHLTRELWQFLSI